MDRIIKTQKGIGTISVDEKKDMPLYMRESAYSNIKGLESVQLKGVRNADLIRINKSDYTQRGE